MARHFLGIAHRVHARICVDAGVCVLGLKGPSGVRKLSPGDRVVYYSPKDAPDGEPLRALTALGEVTGQDAYERSDLASGSAIWVRDTAWDRSAQEVPIRALLENLSFIKNPRNWGFYLQGSHREIPETDYQVIADAMLGTDR